MARFVSIGAGFKRPRRRSPIGTFSSAGGAVAYTATLSPASYAYTGASLAAQTARFAALSAAGYTVTASDLTTLVTRNVALSAASYALTGSSLSALTARFATLSAASFAYTGTGLTTLVTRNVTLSSASFAYTGASLDVVAVTATNYAVELTRATFAFTGASLEASASIFVPPVAETPTASTGGGPAAYGYRGKYRKEIRRTIEAAVRELSEARSPRARKRKIKRVAREIVERFDFTLEPIALKLPEVAMLEPIRLKLIETSLALREKELADETRRAKAQELQRLFGEYETAAKRLDRREEEEALILMTVMAA